jgi:serine protease Do
VVGTDPATDLAVVKFSDKAPQGLAALSFGDSDKVQMGEWVVAIGAPFGLNESITAGIISAKGRQNTGITPYGNFLQTDAAINPGNSGGPLVSLDGKVLGINTAIYSQSGGYQGVGFAIPINLAKSIADSLIKHGKVTRGWLGVSIQNISSEMADALGLQQRTGALVGDVLDGGPAQKAGLQRGDVIVTLAGKEVKDANDLMNRVALLVPGESAELTVLRAGKKLSLKVQIGTRDEPQTRGGARAGGEQDGAELSELGLSVTDLSDPLRSRYGLGKTPKQGALVIDVDAGGPAAEAGLREGDVIVEANRRPVASATELRKAVGERSKGKGVLLLVSRGDATSFVVVTPD